MAHSLSRCAARQLLPVILCTAWLAGCGGGAEAPSSAAAIDPSSAVATNANPSSSGPPAAESLAVQTKTALEVVATGESALVTPPAPGPVETVSVQTSADESAAAESPTEFATAVAVAAVSETKIYVSPQGNDAWSGALASKNATSTDGPVRTISTAQLRARTKLSAMASGATRQLVRVMIAPGQYALTAPLTFTPADSGQPGYPVVYQAETAGTVTLFGGLALGSVSPTAAGQTLTVPAPAIDAANMRGGTQLFAEGRRATLARTPNVGSYWFVQNAVPVAGEPADQLGQEAFAPTPDVLAVVNGLSSADRSRAILSIMQSWTSGRHRVSDLAAPAGSIRVKPRAKWKFLDFGTDQRYILENVPSALDAPGEWIWDGDKVRYISTTTDAGRTFWLVMPIVDKLIVVKGTESTSTYVQDLEFRGLSLMYTRYLTPDEGYVDGQDGSAIAAAIEVDAARRVVIDGCSISRIGGYGVWFRNSVRDSTVSNCTMADLGAGGVKVGLVAQSPTYAAGTGANQVYANRITDIGKVIPGAVGVWIGQSFDNTVSNNLIANTTYSGISVGFNWAYGTATSGRNTINNNLLLNIGQGMLADLGGIYTAGESPGTVITGNVIHEVRGYPSYGSGAWGLYNDGASTGVVMEHNVAVGTSDGGYELSYGRNNTTRNNVFAYGDNAEVRVSRSDPATNLAFSGNLLLPKNTAPLVAYATSPDVKYTSNEVSDRVLTTPSDLAKCGTGCSRVATTLTVGTDPRIITLVGANAATAAWVATVSANVGPPNLPASSIPKVSATPPPVFVAPPKGYVLDLEGATVGGQPLNMSYRPGNLTTNIQAVTSTGTPSGKCLRFTDSAAIAKLWEPYSYATLNHASGTTVAEFSLMIDANTDFLHEWRDDSFVYLTGPSLHVKPTGVTVAGKVVASAAVGQWITIKITAAVGTGAGTWKLEVTNAQGVKTTVNNLAPKDSGWRRLNWLGFVSDAAVASTSCVGYVKADNQ